MHGDPGYTCISGSVTVRATGKSPLGVQHRGPSTAYTRTPIAGMTVGMLRDLVLAEGNITEHAIGITWCVWIVYGRERPRLCLLADCFLQDVNGAYDISPS